MTQMCDNCKVKPVTTEFETWCDDCIEDSVDAVRAEWEDAISEGEPWALSDDEELWNPKYREDEKSE